MSETTAPVTENKSAPAADLSFADAMDAGMDSLNNPTPVAQTPVAETPVAQPVAQTAVKAETIVPAKIESQSTPLDVLTKRMTGQETKSEPVVSEDIDIKTPDNLKPEAQTAWARLTKDLRDTRAKLKEMESKITEAPKDSVEQIDLKNQLDALKSERDEYESELRLSRLESTREYKQAVTEPLNNIQQEVSELAKLYESDPRKIYAAMVEPDPAQRRALLKEATANFDPVDALALRTKAEDLQKVFARREILSKDVSTVLQMIEAQEKEEFETSRKAYEAETMNAYRSEWDNMQKENPLLRPIENNEQWNNTLKGIEQQALHIENTELDPRAKARLTFNAAAMPVVMNVFQDYVSKTQARISELEKLTKELRSVAPSAGSGTGSAPELPADISFVEALERGLNR